jgi:hypothetical protein
MSQGRTAGSLPPDKVNWGTLNSCDTTEMEAAEGYSKSPKRASALACGGRGGGGQEAQTHPP